MCWLNLQKLTKTGEIIQDNIKVFTFMKLIKMFSHCRQNLGVCHFFGHCVYDKYVKPREKVTDYRTAVSGIRPSDIENANNFKEVQKEVSDILTNRVLVGHAIRHDLKVIKFHFDRFIVLV